MGYNGRDVEVVTLNESQVLVAACDSSGAIGMKELDQVKVPWSVTGRFGARVALLEVLSSGAVPQIITVAISNEPEPAGEEILKGVRDELKTINMPSLPMAISTEKNIVTKQTGLGITVVGLCKKDELRIGRSKRDDSIFCLGYPKVGSEVGSPDDPEILQAIDIERLLKNQAVHDIVPVGSRGIGGEAQALAETMNAEFIPESIGVLDLEKSGGPSTCVIFTAPEDIQVTDFGRKPVYKVGKLKRKA